MCWVDPGWVTDAHQTHPHCPCSLQLDWGEKRSSLGIKCKDGLYLLKKKKKKLQSKEDHCSIEQIAL